MAEIVMLEGQQYKKRNPWGAWGWCWLIVPYFVWYYRANDEARRYLRDERINPTLALLSQFVPIVNLISIWRTGERIARMQRQASLTESVQPILGLIASLFYVLHVVYYQSEVNKVWDRAVADAVSAAPDSQLGSGGAAAPLPPPPATMPPPPPPPATPEPPQVPPATPPAEPPGGPPSQPSPEAPGPGAGAGSGSGDAPEAPPGS
jgi:hypothetical protein